MPDYWTDRDLPVLHALVEHFDQLGAHDGDLDLPGATGLSRDEVDRSLAALSRAQPPYIKGQAAMGSHGVPIRLFGVTERAYRAVGAWPTTESLTDQLIEALGRAADNESDPEQRSRLKATTAWLGGAGRSIFAEVAARMIEHQAGLA